MVQFRSGELSQWVCRLWKNGIPDSPVTGISIDTRTLEPGNLYVAIRGERMDGHDFLGQAFEKGAAGALICEDARWTGHPVLAVPDTVKGLQSLAHGYRKKWRGTVVGITGSVGKTTVKEMCAAVLSVGGTTHRTGGNFNNHIGLPLTMIRMPSDARYGVFEVGMNHKGEIGPLAYLLQPKIGILTDIGSVHRENFNSVEEIATEKARLVEQVPGSGLVLLDRDSPWYGLIRQRVCAEVVTLSFEGSADYVGRKVGENLLDVGGYHYTMPLPGEHTMRNALRAIVLGLQVGLAPEQIAEGLRRFELPPMRWQSVELKGVHFINDAYNASPLSMRAVLKTFAGQQGAGAKWAVLGGMLELGDTAAEEHAELGRFVDELGLDGVVTVGALGARIQCFGTQAYFASPDASGAALFLNEHMNPGDSVLLKASRGEHLEQVLKEFERI